MTEYQKDKLLNEANTVKIRESKEYTLSLGRNHKVKSRKPYSESDEYDLETDTDNSTGDSGAGLDNLVSNGPTVTGDEGSRGQGEGCAAAHPATSQVLNNQRLVNVNSRQQQPQRRTTFGSPFMNAQQGVPSRPSSNSYQHHNFNI